MSTLSVLEGLKRKLVSTVSQEDFKHVYEKHLSEITRTATLKGFRTGKVPKDVLEQKFGRGLLQESAAELIRKDFEAQIQAKQVKLVGMPSIDFDAAALKKNTAFDYTATFEIYPDIQLKELIDIEFEKAEGIATDEDVDNMLIRIRTQYAEWQPVERPAKLGDRLTIDFDGMTDGKPLERGSAKGMLLELGSNNMIPGFEEGLIGAKKDEMKALSLSFPKDYHVENLRGKPVEFTVIVHKIEEPKLPALDDAFAEKMGIEKGIVELKQKMKERMQTEMNEMANQTLKNNAFDKLTSLNAIDVPSVLIEAEIYNLQNTMRQRMRMFNPKMTESQLNEMPLSRDLFAEDAKKRVVLGLLLAEIIKANGIKLNQDRVQKQFAKMAANEPNPEAAISAYHKNDRLRSDVEAFVLEEQALELLLAKAIITKVKKNYDAIINKTETRAK